MVIDASALNWEANQSEHDGGNLIKISAGVNAPQLLIKPLSLSQGVQNKMTEVVTEPQQPQQADSGLERAPRTTIDFWAQRVRDNYKKAYTVDWDAVLTKVEAGFATAASVRSKSLILTEGFIPRGENPAPLLKLLQEAHPSMVFFAEPGLTSLGSYYTLSWTDAASE